MSDAPVIKPPDPGAVAVIRPRIPAFVKPAFAVLVATALAACGYVTVRGIRLEPVGKPVADYDASAYKIVLSPRECFDPAADCVFDVEARLYAFGDLSSAAPDSLNIDLPGRDTVLVLDTADTTSGRLWLWGPRGVYDKVDGKTVKAFYWLLAWEVARAGVGDTLSVSFSGRARRSDGTSDTLRIRQAYVVKRFREREMVSL